MAGKKTSLGTFSVWEVWIFLAWFLSGTSLHRSSLCHTSPPLCGGVLICIIKLLDKDAEGVEKGIHEPSVLQVPFLPSSLLYGGNCCCLCRDWGSYYWGQSVDDIYLIKSKVYQVCQKLPGQKVERKAGQPREKYEGKWDKKWRFEIHLASPVLIQSNPAYEGADTVQGKHDIIQKTADSSHQIL